MNAAAHAELLNELESIWRSSGSIIGPDTLTLTVQVTAVAVLARRNSGQQATLFPSPEPLPGSWAHLKAISGPRFCQQLARAFATTGDVNQELAPLFDARSLERQPDERTVGLVLRWALQVAERPDVSSILDAVIAQSDQRSREPVTLPSTVASLLVGLADLQDGQEVADPFCRTGDLLQAAVVGTQRGPAGLRLVGYEQNAELVRIAKLRALVLGSPPMEIETRDALFDPPEAAGRLRRVDRIVTAPPVTLRLDISSLERDPYLRFRMGVQSRTRADIARIEHIVASLEPDGRAVVLVPVGLLFRGGHEERVRAALLREGWIDTIITLPPGAFYGTRISTAILVLRQARTRDERGRIRYINAGDLGEVRRPGPPDAALVQRILLAEMGDAEEEGFVRWVSLAEIEANQWSLAPTPYFPAPSVEIPDPADVAANLKNLVWERDAAEARFDAAATDLAALLGSTR
jgi:hypothetical protein